MVAAVGERLLIVAAGLSAASKVFPQRYSLAQELLGLHEAIGILEQDAQASKCPRQIAPEVGVGRIGLSELFQCFDCLTIRFLGRGNVAHECLNLAQTHERPLRSPAHQRVVSLLGQELLVTDLRLFQQSLPHRFHLRDVGQIDVGDFTQQAVGRVLGES